MLPLQRCRELLSDCEISDQQLEATRDQMYALVRALLEPIVFGLQDSDSVEERAAILEHEAGMSRAEADFRALTSAARDRRQ